MGAADSLCRHFRTPSSVHFNISFYSEAPSFIGSIPYGFDSARQRSGSEVRSKTAFQYLANLRGEGRRCEGGVTGIGQGCPSEHWSIRGLRGLRAQSRASGSVRPRTPRPPPGRGWNSVIWPWHRNRGGPGRAWGSKPALVPTAQKLQTTEGRR